MIPIENTEMYKILFNNTQTSDETYYEAYVAYRTRRHYNPGMGGIAKHDLGRHGVRDILKMCGITANDIKLLEIAKELAKENQ